MNFEENRLNTFENWPEDAPVDRTRVARAGFYYLGTDIEVKCFSCCGIVSDWKYGDKVMARHRLLNPSCPFVENPLDSNNVPISEMTRYRKLPYCTSSKNPDNENGMSASTNFSKYRVTSVRLDSFNCWHLKGKIDIDKLAKAGFFYFQKADMVICAFCGIPYVVELDIDPVIQHRRVERNCPFINRIKIGDDSAVASSECPIVFRSPLLDIEEELGIDTTRVRELGVIDRRLPRKPQFATEESRLLTFKSWPNPSSVKAEDLANAGFFYLGEKDKVRCYHCDGGLEQWMSFDDPWIEHAKWFPDCDFIFLTKGEEFISDAKRMFPDKNQPAIIQKQGNHSLSHSEQKNSSSELSNALTTAMSHPLVNEALDIGIELSSIRSAIRQRLCRGENMFTELDSMIIAALNVSWQTGESARVCRVRYDSRYESYARRIVRRRFPPWHERYDNRITTMVTNDYNTGTEIAVYYGSPDDINIERSDNSEESIIVPINSQNGNDDHVDDTLPSIRRNIDIRILLSRRRYGFATYRPVNNDSSSARNGTLVFDSDDLVRQGIGPMRNIQRSEDMYDDYDEDDDDDDDYDDDDDDIGFDNADLILSYVYGNNNNDYDVSGDSYHSSGVGSSNNVHSENISNVTLSNHDGSVTCMPANDGYNAVISQSLIQKSKNSQLLETSVQKQNVETDNMCSNDSIDAALIKYKEESRLLKEAKLCKVCLDREISILFLTCGHLVACGFCAANIKDCPICRQRIIGTVRTFLP